MTLHTRVEDPVAEDRPRPAWPNLATIIARNLKRLRFRARLTQAALAEQAGLDAAHIERLEAGSADASIALLWRVAGALEVPFAALIADQAARGVVVLRRDRTEAIASADGFFSSRPLTPFDASSLTEFYEVRISAGHVHLSEAHAAGTSETLVVTKGVLEVTVGREEAYRLETGDSMVFQAGLPHAYANPGTETAGFHLVVQYRHG
jgi:transcriptional regulator with XRE-family HTH domain